MRLWPLLLSLFSIVFLARGEDFESRTFTSPDGAKLPYRLLTPQHYEGGKKYPLVLFLHGAGERGQDNQAQIKHGAPIFARADIREKFPCFVVAPQCPKDKQWVDMPWSGPSGTAPADPGSMELLVLATLDALTSEFSIDPDRIYVTGISMGGFGTWDLITRYPEKWAAAVPVCGGGDKSKAGAAKTVEVWAFHGLDDAVVLPVRSRDMILGLRAAGGIGTHTEYPGVQHDSWTLAYAEPNLIPWLFAQQRGVRPQKMETATSQFTTLAMPPEHVFPGAGALQLAPWFQKLWMMRRVDFARNKENDQRAVVFLGDSITQGWSTIATDFPNLKIANRGISGDTARGVRYRLKEDVLDLHAKAVSLLIGTNDLSLKGTPEQVMDNVRAIVAEIHKQNRNVPIILNLVMPAKPDGGRSVAEIQRLNGMLEALAKKEPRTFICDTWSIFDDGKGNCKKEEFPDMLHPNKAGYAKWKAALELVFSDLKL